MINMKTGPLMKKEEIERAERKRRNRMGRSINSIGKERTNGTQRRMDKKPF